MKNKTNNVVKEVAYLVLTIAGPSLLEKGKLEREISDRKNKIPPKFFGRKI